MQRLNIFWLILFLMTFGWSQSLNPTGSLAVHDPSSLVKQGNTYYLFYTGNLIPTKTSTDMINWTSAGSAMSSRPAWHAQYVSSNPTSLWAPDIHFAAGKYWLYYAVSSSGSTASAIGLRTNVTLNPSDANYAWQDQGMVVYTKASNNINDTTLYNAIDPNVFIDTAGMPWMAFGSFWGGIKLIRLNPSTGKVDSTDRTDTLISIAYRNNPQAPSGYTHALEAAFIIYYRGYYYLFTSWDRCCNGTASTYNMRYGRAPSVRGPYVDKAGVKLVSGGGTLLSDGSGLPGGGQSIYQDNGNYYIVYHVYDGKNSPASLQIRHLYFDSQQWPTLDPAQAVSIQTARSRRVAASQGTGELIPWRNRDFNALGRDLSQPNPGIPPSRR